MPAKTKMQVRLIEAAELEPLLALYSHLHRADDPLPDRAVVQAVWSELMANPRCSYFGGYAGKELVATCTLSIIPNLTRGCRSYGVIENVVTHPAKRREGFGKAVLFAALNHAWSQRCYKVMLSTGRKDDATLRFYASAGFCASARQAFVATPP